jgi:hypothetical protein
VRKKSTELGRGDETVERSYPYSRSSILLNIAILSFTIFIAVLSIVLAIVEFRHGRFKGKYILIFVAAIPWITISMYGAAQYVALLKLPFAFRTNGRKLEIKTVSSLLNSKPRDIIIDISCLQAARIHQFGIAFRAPIPATVNGNVATIGGVYLLWRFIKNSEYVSSQINALCES